VRALRISAAAVVALTTITFADPSPSAADLYAEGQAAYDRGDYATAIARWRLSYQVSGKSALLFNVAQALRLSGDCPRAIETYRLFLVADPDVTSDQHRLADEFVRELTPACPPSHESAPSAPVRAPVRAPAPVWAAPDIVSAKIAPIDRARTGEVVGLATAGTGVIAVVAGLATGHHGQSIGDAVTAACAGGCDWTAQEARDASGRRDVAIGYALDGVGAAAIVGGAIAYLVESRHATISVAPNLSEGGATVSWIRSW
jgi:hypothetical protein